MLKMNSKRNHLSNHQVIEVANRVSKNLDEFNGKSAVRIARQLTRELQFPVTPNNVRAMAEPLNIKLRRNKKPARQADMKPVASILLKLCKEVGIDDNHPIMKEIASL